MVAHNRYLQAGGEDAVFADEVGMLRARGHEVHTLEVDNQQMVELSTPKAALTTVWNRPMAQEVSRQIAAFKPDVMHVHNDFMFLSPSIYYAAARHRVPAVLTLHNFRGLCANGLLFRDGQVCEDCIGHALSLPAIRKRCYRDSKAATFAVASRRLTHSVLGTWRKRIAVYVAPTQLVRDRYIAGGYPADRIVVKPHFVTGDPQPGTGEAGFVLFIGRLSTEKGIDRLLAAWHDVPGTWRLKIVGRGEEQARVEAAAADPARRIDYLGSQTPDQVQELLDHAAAAVIPSPVYETFSRVVAESFAAGTPVIAADHGGPGELIDHRHTGLLYNAAQPDALRGTLLKALAAPATLHAMRPACRHTFETRFTQNANYPQLLAIYRRALGQTPLANPKTASQKLNPTLQTA